MATNLAIDPALLEEALRIGGLSTKKATVTEALKEFIARRKQRELLEPDLDRYRRTARRRYDADVWRLK